MVGWIPMSEVPRLIERGEIAGSGSTGRIVMCCRKARLVRSGQRGQASAVSLRTDLSGELFGDQGVVAGFGCVPRRRAGREPGRYAGRIWRARTRDCGHRGLGVR